MRRSFGVLATVAAIVNGFAFFQLTAGLAEIALAGVLGEIQRGYAAAVAVLTYPIADWPGLTWSEVEKTAVAMLLVFAVACHGTVSGGSWRDVKADLGARRMFRHGRLFQILAAMVLFKWLGEATNQFLFAIVPIAIVCILALVTLSSILLTVFESDPPEVLTIDHLMYFLGRHARGVAATFGVLVLVHVVTR